MISVYFTESNTGGGVLSPKLYVDVPGACRTLKIWLSLYQFFAYNFPPIRTVYCFRKKSTQFWPNWVLSTIICQNTPNLCNLGSFVSDEPPPHRYTKFAKKPPKRQAHIMLMWEPPSDWNKMEFELVIHISGAFTLNLSLTTLHTKNHRKFCFINSPVTKSYCDLSISPTTLHLKCSSKSKNSLQFGETILSYVF